MSDSSFRQAQERYARIRAATYTQARDDALASGRIDAPLRLAECDRYTLSVWKSAWAGPHPSGWGAWDWEPLLRRAWRNPAAFHLAVWSGKVLCGLAVGRVSRKDGKGIRLAVSIDFIASAHDPRHPLRGNIAWLATSAGEAYGRALGAQWLRLLQPLPGVLPLYTRLGFSVVGDNDQVLYCERRI